MVERDSYWAWRHLIRNSALDCQGIGRGTRCGDLRFPLVIEEVKETR